MKKLITITFSLIALSFSLKAQTSDTIRIRLSGGGGALDTAAMLDPYKTSYPRQAVSLVFTTTGSSGAATGTYNNGTGVFTFNVPQYSGGAGTSIYAGKWLRKSSDSANIYLADSIYRPEDFGAVGDSITNDAAAFTAMVTAMPSWGGQVSLAAKKYLINTQVVINKPIKFVGQGIGDHYYAGTQNLASTQIITDSSIHLFSVTENGPSFEKIAFRNRHTKATAGSALYFGGNARTGSLLLGYTVNYCSFYGFYDNINATNVAEWSITNSYFRAPVRYGIYVACTSLPDAGDSYITGCQFLPRTDSSTAAIYQESSGGLRILNNKFNAPPGVGAAAFLRSIHSNILSATMVYVITGNSIENYKYNAIKIETAVDFRDVIIANNQFASHYNAVTNPAIDIYNVKLLSITGNVMEKSVGGSNDTAIKLNTVVDATIMNAYRSYGTKLSSTSGTRVSNVEPQWTDAGTDIYRNSKVGIGNIPVPLFDMHMVNEAAVYTRGLTVEQNSTGTHAAIIAFQKSRGTNAAKTAVVAGDVIGIFSMKGYSGSSYLGDNSQFGAQVTGTPSGSSVPTSLFFTGGTTAGRYVPDLLVYHNGNVGVGMGGTYIPYSINAPTAKLHIGAGTTAIAPLQFNTGPVLTTKIAGTFEYTTPQLFFTNGGLQRQEIPLIQQKRISTQYNRASATLADITGLSVDLTAGKTYRIEAKLYTTSPVAAGVKFAIGGTATATAIIYEGITRDAGVTTQSRGTAMAATVGAVTAVTAAYTTIEGTITVNAAGTLTVQFAQNVFDASNSSVLVGSTFVITEML